MIISFRGIFIFAISCLSVTVSQADNLPTTVQAVSASAGRGHPFGSPSFAKVPLDIGTLGYEEQEYLFSGIANLYTENFGGVRVLDSGAYTDRMLVRRPVDPSRFSGNVILEVINGQLDFDGIITWTQTRRRIVGHGDIWVGISTLGGIPSLRQSDPQRYGKLSFANPNLPAPAGCSSSGPEEPGLIYDIISQAATLLRQTDDPNNPLHGLAVKAIIATGYSRTALTLSTYTNLIVPTLDRRPIDAYLVAAGGLGDQLNLCGQLHLGMYPHSHGEPVMQVQTPSETAGIILLPAQLIDSNTASNKYRYYDIAGSAHLDQVAFDGVPDASELATIGKNLDATLAACKDISVSRFPTYYAYDGLLAALEAWTRDGTPAPPSQRFLLSSAGGLGTSTGGLVTPAIDVPTASNALGGAPVIPLIGLLPSCTGGDFTIPKAFIGAQTDFSPTSLRLRYGDHAGYVNQLRQSAAKRLQDRFITEEDAADIIQQAEAASIP